MGQPGSFSLPPDVVDIILSAKQHSTKTVYAGRWVKFVKWCGEKSIDPLKAHLSEVLNCALSLAQQGCAVATVNGFLSALSTFLCSPDHPSLFKSPIVMRFVKGLTNRFPPTPFIMPQWDLNLVLAFLMGLPCEPLHSCPLRFLAFKTIFFVAITSIRRVSELQALSSKPPFTSFHVDKMVLRT